MRSHILISFLLMLSFLPISAQYIWQLESETHRFEIQVDTTREGDSISYYYTYSIPKILVYPQQGNARPQEIHPKWNGISKRRVLEPSQFVKLIDVNFDGILDFELKEIQLMNLSTSHFWICDPETNLLEPHQYLSNMTALEFLEEHKMIYSYYHIESNQYGHALWQWQGDQLSLVFKEELVKKDYEPGLHSSLEIREGETSRKIDLSNPFPIDIQQGDAMYLYRLYLEYKQP